MKIKQATLLAIIGVIFQLIPFLILTLCALEVMATSDWNKYLIVVITIGNALLLPFFVILFKSQK